MGYVNISKIYENMLMNINEKILSNDIIEGCHHNILSYIEQVAPNKIKKEQEEIFVDEEILTKEFIEKYFEKSKNDYSAKDCAYIALHRVGVPPIHEMSVESLEKTIREIFKEEKGKVYIKRSKGKGNAVCVDLNTARSIVTHSEVVSLIGKQTGKAERKQSNTVEWRAYNFEKEKIAYIESGCSDNNCYREKTLSVDEKAYLMVEAIYRKLFSDFDYDKYEKYCDEMELLYDNWDFGERYQELYDIFNSQNYKNEFYEYKTQDNILDTLTDILAEKIVKKMNGKGG